MGMITEQQRNRLLTALRLGRKKKPEQITGRLFGSNNNGACAIGAIALGLGFKPEEHEDVEDAYNFVNEKIELNPALDIINHIWRTNDDAQYKERSPDDLVIEYIKSL